MHMHIWNHFRFVLVFLPYAVYFNCNLLYIFSGLNFISFLFSLFWVLHLLFKNVLPYTLKCGSFSDDLDKSKRNVFQAVCNVHHNEQTNCKQNDTSLQGLRYTHQTMDNCVVLRCNFLCISGALESFVHSIDGEFSQAPCHTAHTTLLTCANFNVFLFLLCVRFFDLI